MPVRNEASRRARVNLSTAIDEHRRFPMKIFVEHWSAFFFFDSDWIFDAQFVEKTKELLEAEGGQCAYIADLDAPPELEGSSFFIENEITSLDFQSFLKGLGPGEGWAHSINRFGCTSDISEWCIYCEKRNEIAVIAFRDNGTAQKYWTVIAHFKALSIEQAIAIPLSYGFSERALSAEWREEFLRQYQTT